MTHAEILRRIEFLYWAERRRLTSCEILWRGCGIQGGFQALDDASYCLDRPDPLTRPWDHV